jgi:tetratricopeptide (TPR) repeat protein
MSELELWHELGNIYFNVGDYDKAIDAYGKVLKLDPGFGWLYSNLGQAYAHQGRNADAIPLYRKSLELLENDKEKAITWNRLGNAYRRLNDYENALAAFKLADEFNLDSSIFKDDSEQVNQDWGAVEMSPELSEAVMQYKTQMRVMKETLQSEMASLENELGAVDETSAPAEDLAEESLSTGEQTEAVAPVADESEVAEPVAAEALADVPVADESEEAVAAEAVESESTEAVSEEPEDVVAEAPAAEEPEEAAAADAVEPEPVVAAAEEAVAEAPAVVEPEEAVAAQAVEPEAAEAAVEEAVAETPAADESEEAVAADAVELEPAEAAAAEEPEEPVATEEVEPESVEDTVAEAPAAEEPGEAVAVDSVEPEQVEAAIEDAVGEAPIAEKFEEATAVESVEPEAAEAAEEEAVAETPAAEKQEEAVAPVAVEPEPVEVSATEDAFVESPTTDAPVEAVAPDVDEPESVPVEGELEAEALTSSVESKEVVTLAEASPDMAEEAESNDLEVGLKMDLLTADPYDAFNLMLKGGLVEVEEKMAAKVEGNGNLQPVTLQENTATLPVSERVNGGSSAAGVAKEGQAEAAPAGGTGPTAASGLAMGMQVVEQETMLAELEPSQAEGAQEVVWTVAEEETMEQGAEADEQEAEASGESPVEEVESVGVSAEIDPEGVPYRGAADQMEAETDSKNAHIWNELGNIYFTTGAYEQAVKAYKNAIQLDGRYGWPYGNLGLTYAHQGHYEEAIPLYQQSLELLSSEKDQAVMWNRLGNAYRRLNDYENAAKAYRMADGLDTKTS